SSSEGGTPLTHSVFFPFSLLNFSAAMSARNWLRSSSSTLGRLPLPSLLHLATASSKVIFPIDL
ncbi:hypothetical protein PFISCL1PPCAC_21137, partial [Pristionchus fissidentatus]